MKRTFWTIGALLLSIANLSAEELRIAIAADVHVMSQSLVVEDGAAFEKYVASDRKMLKESTALLAKLKEKILEESPKYLLIAGDLTKDGELESHKYLYDNCFKWLIERGIQPLVIPGNHDVNNPHAVAFDGDKTERVETLSAEGFADLYAECGYADAVARDPHSLTYIYKLSDDLQLLAIDACKYDQNDFEADECHHDGVIKEETFRFIEEQLQKSQKEGIRTIAMMHHGIVEHWKYQNKMIPGYLVEEWEKAAQRLNKLGVEVLFSGHSHAQDAAEYKGITDIQTGSAVSYPCPYRTATITDDNITIKSHTIESIDFDLGGQNLSDYARKNTENGFKFHINQMFPESIPAEISSRAVDIIAEGMTAHYAGDESLSDELAKEIKTLGKQIRKYSFKWGLVFKKVSKALYTDSEPADNDLTITFKK